MIDGLERQALDIFSEYRARTRMDAVIADTVAKIKAVPTSGPFPAKRKRP